MTEWRDVRRLLDRLTRTTPEMTKERDNHGVLHQMVIQEPPLFGLLRGAVHPDAGGKSSGGNRRGQPAPVSAEAVDLFMLIDKASIDLWWRFAPSDGKWRYQSMEERIVQWVEAIEDLPAAWDEACRVLTDWLTRIEGLITPSRAMELRGSTCPACRNQWAYHPEGDEVVRKIALVVTIGSVGVHAVCRCCRAEWPASSLQDLDHQIDQAAKEYTPKYP